MTEEIKIDGVNVAECCCFENNRCLWTKRYYENNNVAPPCEAVKNCYYKQLKRLEQENKELKEINTALIQEAEDVAEARMEICNQCGNRDDYNIPCKMIRDLDYGLNITIEERDTYRSALEEIREKAKHCIKQDVCAFCDYSKECAVPDTDGLVYDNNRLLIKLINEMLK